MGLHFKELVVKQEISIADLRGKVLAVDAMNMLYQFLTTIRGPEGLALTDANGHVTSHLIGLFSRTTALMEAGLKLVFVFDGKAPELKQKTWEKRTGVKEEAALKYEEAKEVGNLEEMKKFGSRTAVLTREMREEAQHLIRALGLPIIQAPSEGEAQTAYMVKMGRAYASISQDYDNLIFGCPRLIRNLSIDGKRKKTGKLGYQIVKPEQILLEEVLTHLHLSQDQLITLAILVGTDYNPGGVRGIGPKTGLKLVKEYSEHQLPALFDKVEWAKYFPEVGWQEIFDTIKYIPVTDSFTLEWKQVDEKEVYQLLVEKHNFSVDRVKGKMEKLREANRLLAQKGLGAFF